MGERHDRYYRENRDKIISKQHSRRNNDKEHVRAIERKSYLKNVEKKRAFGKKYYAKNKDKINEAVTKKRAENHAEYLGYAMTYHQKYRAQALEFYGGGDPKCVCCGERTIEFLTLNHINNDGAKHRKEVHTDMYRWAVKNGFPPIFNILCMNCNHSLGVRGYCPHQNERRLAS